MKRYTKRCDNDIIEIEAEEFIECALKRLAIYEDFFSDKGLMDRLSWILDMEVETDEDMMRAILRLIDDTYRNLSSRLGGE